VFPSQAAAGDKRDLVQVDLSPEEAETLRWYLVGGRHDKAIKIADTLARKLVPMLSGDWDD
jgi:hypothetical protein